MFTIRFKILHLVIKTRDEIYLFNHSSICMLSFFGTVLKFKFSY